MSYPVLIQVLKKSYLCTIGIYIYTFSNRALGVMRFKVHDNVEEQTQTAHPHTRCKCCTFSWQYYSLSSRLVLLVMKNAGKIKRIIINSVRIIVKDLND